MPERRRPLVPNVGTGTLAGAVAVCPHPLSAAAMLSRGAIGKI
jgi:hypothetical protein